MINSNAGGRKSSLHVRKPPSRAEESSDVEEVKPREGETVEDKLSMSIKLQNVNTH